MLSRLLPRCGPSVRASLLRRSPVSLLFTSTPQLVGQFSSQAGDSSNGEPFSSGLSFATTPLNSKSVLSLLPSEPFSEEVATKLQRPIKHEDVEIKPDGTVYLPEIKYRRILNAAFGPGGWVLVPLSEPKTTGRLVEREYALFCFGKFVSQAYGDHTFLGLEAPMSLTNEAAKSRALVRVCKDLGVASELWDPEFITKWKEKYAVDVWCENLKTKEKRKLWRRKDRPTFPYPWKEGISPSSSSSSS